MHCVVTAGPTYEELDHVRRLTNFSTGRLGSELVNFLADSGHEVTLLIALLATYRGPRRAKHVQTFTTTSSLRDHLRALGDPSARVDAVFHAAAVSDFKFGKVWSRSADGQLTELRSGKLSTREGTLLAELVPTTKIISHMRDWFPRARLVGWKYEVDGDRPAVLRLAERQLAECRTDACVMNGPGYGTGFGLLQPKGASTHFDSAPELYAALGKLLQE